MHKSTQIWEGSSHVSAEAPRQKDEPDECSSTASCDCGDVEIPLPLLSLQPRQHEMAYKRSEGTPIATAAERLQSGNCWGFNVNVVEIINMCGGWWADTPFSVQLQDPSISSGPKTCRIIGMLTHLSLLSCQAKRTMSAV